MLFSENPGKTGIQENILIGKYQLVLPVATSLGNPEYRLFCLGKPGLCVH